MNHALKPYTVLLDAYLIACVYCKILNFQSSIDGAFDPGIMTLDHYTTISTRRHHLYQCSECGHQTTVTVGTIMEISKLSLVKWFLALFFMAQNKNSVSSVALAKDLGITQGSAWLMLRKIRSAMGFRDTLYMLGGTVEMDEGFIGGKKSGGKRGRGVDKTKVVIALKISGEWHPIFLKMEVIADCKGVTLTILHMKILRKVQPFIATPTVLMVR